jgi:hypothetical protein
LSIIFFSRLLCLKDTVGCGDDASPHDVIDVVIDGRKQKTPASDAGVGSEKFQSARTDRVLPRGGRLPGDC